MSLYFYTKSTIGELEKEVIRDNEDYFKAFTVITDCEFVRNVLRVIEKAKYLNDVRFIDRFDVGVYFSNLSTGCKTIFNIYYHPDKIFSCIECGYNALDVIFKMQNGRIYLPDIVDETRIDWWRDALTGEESDVRDIYYRGVHFDSSEEIDAGGFYLK